MTRQESLARRRLGELAREERGRQLLQLALRGIQTSGRGLTIGCWIKPGGGVSGCVFQHAYWQGVAEGVFGNEAAESVPGNRVAKGAFGDRATASREIRDLVPERDFHLVMEAIRALDALGKRRFARGRSIRRGLDENAWRAAVERLLVDVLADRAPAGDRVRAAVA